MESERMRIHESESVTGPVTTSSSGFLDPDQVLTRNETAKFIKVSHGLWTGGLAWAKARHAFAFRQAGLATRSAP
jgi:hypothetical protein